MRINSINKIFGKMTMRILKHRLLVVISFIGILAFSFVGMKRIMMKTSFDDYFIKDDPMLIKTNEFKSIFGNDYYVAVLVNNDNIFSHESLKLIRELRLGIYGR